MLLTPLILLAWATGLPGQNSGKPGVATVAVKGPVAVKRGGAITVPVTVTVARGYHVTSATPGDRYLKPLRLTWEKGALTSEAPPRYPKAVLRSYPFSEGKLSVLDGTFTIEQDFRAPATAAQGFGAITGKLHYQACTDTECLPPATVPVRLSYDIR